MDRARKGIVEGNFDPIGHLFELRGRDTRAGVVEGERLDRRLVLPSEFRLDWLLEQGGHAGVGEVVPCPRPAIDEGSGPPARLSLNLGPTRSSPPVQHVNPIGNWNSRGFEFAEGG